MTATIETKVVPRSPDVMSGAASSLGLMLRVEEALENINPG